MKTFDDLKVDPMVLSALNKMGFEEPTPIQEQTIPPALEGRDLIGRAQTGTGKTAAYGIPMVSLFSSQIRGIQGLVITPTRELAIQAAEELNRIGLEKHIWAMPIYGGQDMERQMRGLRKRPSIIAATPGRLLDHMRRKSIDLSSIKVLVLDEADEMLNMGFKEDIEHILRSVPDERQTLLFSATMPLHILKLAREFMRNPETIHIAPKEVTVSQIQQMYVETTEHQKLDVLCRLLDVQKPALCIVFARTKKRVDEIAKALNSRSYSAHGLHGDFSQNTRDDIMHRFKAGEIDILVATDVAARGLDVSGVSHVYNFDIPQDAEGYVHRIGRTGRAGESGSATTLVCCRELGHLKYIEQIIKHKINRIPVPTVDEALAGIQKAVAENLQRVVETEDTGNYKRLAERLLIEHDSITILSAALKLLTREPENTPFKELTQAPPIKLRSMEPFSSQRRYNNSKNKEKRGIQKGNFNRNGIY